jgi:hypothetical protein
MMVQAVNRLRPRFVVLSGPFTTAPHGHPDFAAQMDRFLELVTKLR